MKEVPCVVFRGGTSKGLFFLERDIPKAGQERDAFLLSVMGSPDIRQIDGLGGANSLTSKVAIISKAESHEYDVNYTFVQVSVDKAVVDYRGNCGNLLSAVGYYAIEMGLVEAKDGVTTVRIFNTNTKKIIYSHIQTPSGRVNYDGDFSISGVPGTSAPIKLCFKNPAGAVTGKILPTGQPVDILAIPEVGALKVSVVDVANPLVFVKAEDIGMTGKELPEEIDNSLKILNLLESIRGLTAQKLGFVDDWRDASVESPAVPKIAVVANAASYHDVGGEVIDGRDIDLLGRMMSMQKAHRTYALTGALCTAAAAVIPGTVVNQILRSDMDSQDLKVGHPSGIIRAGVDYQRDETRNISIGWAWSYRTARMLMRGTAYYR